ncbi:MAG: CDGSH iron-sulfur domain-containing protein [Acidobacteriota bacterium]|nr:CDGSH iron-sulfur domain-containing protein [Acidobacteriota bacterium]
MEPQIAKKVPAVLALEPGTYWWCACGLSKTQPFCDSSHKGSGLAPLKFILAESERVALCQCKHSGNKPFCDGAHKAL